MDFKVILLFVSCFYITKASESSEELNEILSSDKGTEFLRAQLKQMYQEEKLEMIASWIDMMSNDDEVKNNATVVGTQTIYNEDGSIKEVRTIELFIPNLEKQSAISKLKESANQENEDDDDDFNVSELMETFQQMSKLGFEVEISATERGKDPKENSMFYIEPDLMYVYNEGVAYVNITKTVNTVAEVKEKIEALQSQKNKPRNLPISVLSYDANRKLLSDKSKIEPELLAYIKDMEGDIPEPMQKEMLYSLVKSSLENPHNRTQVCQDVVTHLEDKFPTGKFLVLSEDVDGMYISKDVSMEVAFSFTDLDEDDKVYKIYGVLVK